MSTQITVGTKRKSQSESVAAAKRARDNYRKRKLSTQPGHLHKHIRSCNFRSGGTNAVIGLDLRDGFIFNGASTGVFNMQFAFTLQGVSCFFGGVSTFTAAMPNNTEFVNLYDQYRIDYVDCEFMFSNNNSSTSSPGTTLPVMYLAKDYDDTGVAGINEIMQYSKQKTWQLGYQHGNNGKYRVRIKPNVDLALYQGVTTGYARGKPLFIDTGSPSVPHYGIKIAYDPIFTPGSATNVGYLTCNFVYHMTMNNTK